MGSFSGSGSVGATMAAAKGAEARAEGGKVIVLSTQTDSVNSILEVIARKRKHGDEAGLL
jgi:hypothetical protein